MSGHEELMLLVETIDRNTRETRDLLKVQNGRLRRAEMKITGLNVAVFGAGAAALTWLLYLHMVK